MKHIENLHEILDETITKQHGIVTSMINMAKSEIAGESINEKENGLLEMEFKNLQSSYRKLRKVMAEYKIEEYKAGTSTYLDGSITVDNPVEVQKDDRLILNVREDMLDYIKDAYTSMQYIVDEENGDESIYDGEDYESFRDLEYEIYKYNISAIESKDDIDNCDPLKLPYQYKASIIGDIAEIDAYEKALEKYQIVIDALDSDDENCRFSEEEVQKYRSLLIYKKYEEKFRLLNSRYNGIITEDLGMYKYLQTSMKINSLPLALGLSEDDYNRLENSIVEKYLYLIDDDIKDILFPKEDKENEEELFDILENEELETEDNERE